MSDQSPRVCSYKKRCTIEAMSTSLSSSAFQKIPVLTLARKKPEIGARLGLRVERAGR